MANTRRPGGGRKPKPTRLKVVEGNRGKRALNKSEPDVGTAVIGDPPDHLYNDVAKEKWAALAIKLNEAGHVSEVDLHNLEAFCNAYALAREAQDHIRSEGLHCFTADGSIKKSPSVTILNEANRTLSTFGALLGLDPASRSRLVVPGGGKEENPFSKFAK